MFENIEEEQHQKLMANLYAYPLGGQLQPPTEDWINSAKRLAKISSIRGTLYFISSFLVYLTMLAFADESRQDSYLGLLCSFLMIVTFFKSRYTETTICDPLRRGLRKLSNGSNCHNALALIEKFDTCREYRAQVLAQGREFIEFDYQLLHAIAERHPDYQEELDADAACKKLHGLAQSPA